MRKLWPLTTRKPYTLSFVEDYHPHSSSAPFGGTFPPGEGMGAAKIFTQALWNVEKIPVENLFFKSSSKCLWKTKIPSPRACGEKSIAALSENPLFPKTFPLILLFLPKLYMIIYITIIKDKKENDPVFPCGKLTTDF